jgi:formate hydrogenlyase subunit 6/NADH:ubiquinone oxidoreductase subunit I
MGYFSNGTEGSVFDYQCSLCKYGEEPCPIRSVQEDYNYDACNDKTARAILDELVADNGTCAMWKQFKKDFRIDPEAKDISLFDICFNE